MATQMSQQSYTFKGTRADTLFFKPVYLGLEESGLYRVMAGVTSKQDIAFVGAMDRIMQKNTGCGFTPKGNLDIYDRTIEVDDVKVDMSQCSDNLKNTLLEETIRKGTEENNTAGTLLSSMTLMRIKQGIQIDSSRLFWFGDKASIKPDFNMTDGMWTVHIPKLVGANLTPYVDANSGTALAVGDAKELLQKVWKAQKLVLKKLDKSMKKFYVSTSVYDGYQDDLEVTGNGDAARFQLINGVERLVYRGIEVVEMPYWEQYDLNDFGADNVHRVLLTTPQNLIIGTDLASSKNSIKVKFDEFEEETVYKVKWKFGTNYVHEELMVAAY